MTKTITIELESGLEVEIEFTAVNTSMNPREEEWDLESQFDTSGLTDEQIDEVEETIASKEDDWLEELLTGDEEDEDEDDED